MSKYICECHRCPLEHEPDECSNGADLELSTEPFGDSYSTLLCNECADSKIALGFRYRELRF